MINLLSSANEEIIGTIVIVISSFFTIIVPQIKKVSKENKKMKTNKNLYYLKRKKEIAICLKNFLIEDNLPAEEGKYVLLSNDTIGYFYFMEYDKYLVLVDTDNFYFDKYKLKENSNGKIVKIPKNFIKGTFKREFKVNPLISFIPLEELIEESN